MKNDKNDYSKAKSLLKSKRKKTKGLKKYELVSLVLSHDHPK